MSNREDFEVQLPQAPQGMYAEAPVPMLDMASHELAAAQAYDPSNRTYSTVLGDGSTAVTLTQNDIENFSVSPQSDKEKTTSIINIIRQYVNKDDLIGITVEAIENNVNARYRLHWAKENTKEAKGSDFDEAKKAIEEFNEKIGLKKLIRDSTAGAYQDGTYIMLLRSSGKKPEGEDLLPDYVVDWEPIGVAEVSQYTVGGDPYVLIDMNELKSRLRKTYTRTKRNKPLFYENEAKEIEATYPKEVKEAYKAGERYAKLDIRYTGVIRVNNQNKQYGLSPIFRALSPTVMLEALGKADRMTAKARAKKVLAQYMNKEILGPNWEKDTYKQQAYAHNTLLSAWANSIVLVTTPATVSKIEYVEPQAEMTSVDTINYYRNRVMSTLGISFLADGNSKSLTIANLSVKQLMKSINKITSQLENILYKWYRVVLSEAGIDPEYAPHISVIDAEMLEMEMRKDLADFLFSKIGVSYDTTLDLLGLNANDEKIKREAENDEGMDEIFFPRRTAFNSVGGQQDDENGRGRPAEEEPDNPDRQLDDKQRNDVKD